jgi:Predicted membrane protein
VASQMNGNDSISPDDVSLTEQEARDIATGEVGGTVLEVELESENGTPAYEVEIETDNGSVSEAAVHANTGSVLGVEQEDEEDEDEQERSVSPDDVSLTEQEARDVATGEVGGAVLEVELESENGTPVYEVEIETDDGTVSEVAVHANNGTVLGVEQEDEEEGDDGYEDDS